jgi:hypothetical protein
MRQDLMQLHEMENNWIQVYSTSELYKAELLKEFLADHGIMAFVLNKQDSFYKFGDIEVYTGPDDVMKAKLLIEKFEN